MSTAKPLPDAASWYGAAARIVGCSGIFACLLDRILLLLLKLQEVLLDLIEANVLDRSIC